MRIKKNACQSQFLCCSFRILDARVTVLSRFIVC